jgi:hypothetical protein
MDFSNERYVRLYVRETTTFRLLAFEGQALMPHVLRLVDRSGVLELGGVTPVEALMLALPRWPSETIEKGLDELLKREVVEIHDGAIVWPRFVEAQETPASSAKRNREYRATKRPGDETKRLASETKRTLSEPEEKEEPEERDFARVMTKYPKRAGSNPRGPAFEAWRARRKDGVSVEVLESAVERYQRFCEATGKVGTETVQQAASFFGPKKRGYLETWDVPAGPNGHAPLGKYTPC